MRNLPHWVQVHNPIEGYFSVSYWAGVCWQQLATGNAEEVHTWLAANGYKRASGAHVVLTGEYKREGLGCAA